MMMDVVCESISMNSLHAFVFYGNSWTFPFHADMIEHGSVFMQSFKAIVLQKNGFQHAPFALFHTSLFISIALFLPIFKIS
jgi:hypothetical protein